MCWSASVDDLSDWRYEGVIYERCADPLNSAGKMCLYAPDVTVGPDGRDGDKEQGYIANIQDTATAGFKYFDCHNITAMSIQTRGYCDGVFEIRTSWEGEILGEIRVAYTNFWETFSTQVRIPDGVQAIYLTYRGGGNASLRSFNLQSD